MSAALLAEWIGGTLRCVGQPIPGETGCSDGVDFRYVTTDRRVLQREGYRTARSGRSGPGLGLPSADVGQRVVDDRPCYCVA